METGAITGYIDVAQLVLYLFWAFFAALIFYLRTEDKREGYPLEGDRPGESAGVGFPPLPQPKVFQLGHGGTYSAPSPPEERPRPIAAEPTAPWPGAPLEPTGDPMLDGVGPASWAERVDEPEKTVHGTPRIIPMRLADGFSVAEGDPDPRGMTVFGADGEPGGRVADLWVDLAEPQVRYLEIEVGDEAGSRRVLLPIALATVQASRIRVSAILGKQFARVPAIASESQVSQLEEDRICAYYAGGFLYADPARQESLL